MAKPLLRSLLSYDSVCIDIPVIEWVTFGRYRHSASRQDKTVTFRLTNWIYVSDIKWYLLNESVAMLSYNIYPLHKFGFRYVQLAQWAYSWFWWCLNWFNWNNDNSNNIKCVSSAAMCSEPKWTIGYGQVILAQDQVEGSRLSSVKSNYLSLVMKTHWYMHIHIYCHNNTDYIALKHIVWWHCIYCVKGQRYDRVRKCQTDAEHDQGLSWPCPH